MSFISYLLVSKRLSNLINLRLSPNPILYIANTSQLSVNVIGWYFATLEDNNRLFMSQKAEIAWRLPAICGLLQILSQGFKPEFPGEKLHVTDYMDGESFHFLFEY